MLWAALLRVERDSISHGDLSRNPEPQTLTTPNPCGAALLEASVRGKHFPHSHANPEPPTTKCPRRAALLKAEEESIAHMCDAIIAFKPDVVITEKGLSDLAAHFLTKAGISAIRRLRKTDNNRIARACGATIVHR